MDIKLITLSNYVRPALVEHKSRNWVLNGANNSFYQYIIDRNNGSPTNASINRSYSTLTYGKGLGFSNVISDKVVNDWATLHSILRPRELRKMVADYQVFGEFSFQVIENRDGSLNSLTHLPKQMVVPSIADMDGSIKTYWYSRDWTDIKKEENEPKEFKAFGDGKAGTSIYVAKPYSIGDEYFGTPCYAAGLQYCEMEEEISNMNISSIKNGLSAGYIINIPNGDNYTDDEKRDFENQVKRKLTSSSNASNFIISFNGQDVEISVTPFPVNTSVHKQWEFLTSEAKNQIMTSHRVISPSLVGLDSATGFSSQAEMIDVSEKQLLKRVIAPKQDFIIESLEEVLVHYGINLDLMFKPLTQEEEIKEIVEESDSDNVEMSSQCGSKTELSDDMESILEMYAQDAPEGYELGSEEEYELQMSANQTSEQDTKLWKTRYAFTKGTSKTPKGQSRAFCNKMVALSDGGKVFRKEDIDLMSSQGVNGQFAHEGGKYDIFKYGGGVNCYHRFERRVYKKKLNADGTPKKGGAMQQTDFVNVNEAKRQGYKPVKNDSDVAKAEIDKPNRGSLK